VQLGNEEKKHLVGATLSAHAGCMSDLAHERSGELRSEGKRHFWLGVSLVILLFFSAACVVLMLFIVPKFEQIYQDALPGKPLPLVTLFIILHRIAITLFDLAWPILGIYLFRVQKNYAILWINVGILFFFLQIGITVIALFMPMIGIEVGMSDAKP
jgi:hypothetical protein